MRGVQSADQLLDVLLKLDSGLLGAARQYPVRLIVIDSVTALFRGEFENSPADLKRRSSLFFKISGKLRGWAERFGLAVVVTNQVVDLVVGNGAIPRIGNLGSLWSSGRRVCGALGLAWANCINSRLFLSRNNEEKEEEETATGNTTVVSRPSSRRHLHVVFAPHLPESFCEFVISREGVFGVER